MLCLLKQELLKLQLFGSIVGFLYTPHGFYISTCLSNRSSAYQIMQIVVWQEELQ